jgi:flagellar M-ring protein FliF
MLQPVVKFWQSATAASKLGLAVFLLAALVLAGVVVSVISRPSFAPLYSRLRPEDASRMVEKLKDSKVPYRLSAEGTTLEVPSSQVYELRLRLAQDGLPQGGHVGFEIFDNSRVGLTDFGEHINYQRALQGELERTISELEGVEYARVHLALPERSLYLEDEKKPSASVVLKLDGGPTLTPQQVRGVVHLVSAAVEGLPPEEVKIVDTSGKLLSAGAALDGDAGGASLLSHLQLQRAFELQLEQKVQSMLDQVVGPGKAIVRISAAMDFDQVELEESVFQPQEANHGVLASQQELHETYRGSGSLPAAVGVPGVTSNTGPRTLPPVAAGGADSYERLETTSSYNVTKRVQHSTVAPGKVNRLSMALFVDQALKAARLSALQEAAAAAAGLDSKRGDTIVVERVSFAEPEKVKDKGVRSARAKEFYFTIGKDVAAALLLVIFLVFARTFFKGRRYEPAPQQLQPPASEAPGARETGPAAPLQAPTAGPGNGDALLAGVDSEKMAHAIKVLMSESEEA